MENLYQENLRLAEENRKLLQWQQVALKLSAENEAMRGLLKVVPEIGMSYVTARLIGNSGGGYMRTVMVNAGADQGAARGQAAIAEGGLIGRLTEVGSRAARVLLITDLNSRIPVVIPTSRTRAVLAGDNSDRPHLVFASEPKAIKIGDRVVTSGDGGVFPPGLPVGIVAALDQGNARIEPYAELRMLDYVLLVDYGLAGGLPTPTPTGRGQDRRGKAPGADEKRTP
jgi:rod shape-determining protein MreC